jgi:hypothetical protein
MPNVIVIFASSAEAEMSQVGLSDRAAIGLAVSRFAKPATGYCPDGDEHALNYGMAAKIARVVPLALPSGISDFDVALVGQCALTEFGAELAGMLAETKKATLVFDVLDVYCEVGQLRIVKDVGRGDREEWIVSGPVVLVTARDAVHPPYVSRYRRMMAARTRSQREPEHRQAYSKPAAEWEGVRPRAKLNRRAHSNDGLAEDRMSAAFGITGVNRTITNDRLIAADAATCASHLMRYLAHHGFLPAKLTDAPLHEEPICAAALSPQPPETPRIGGCNVSIRQGASRGPRFASDSPARLARRPRISPTAGGQLPANASWPRCPRPGGRTPSGLSRRPRKLPN